MVTQPSSIPRNKRVVSIDAKPAPISIDLERTGVLVIDMQNDFGSKGGMFDKAGIDLSPILQAVSPTARVLSAARRSLRLSATEAEPDKEHVARCFTPS